jgi:hypothetical protein
MISLDTAIDALENGVVELKGQFNWGSNYTFLVDVAHQGHLLKAVYKPDRGARPLWDFPPDSLARGGGAGYIVSEALGWRLVPPTVYRQEAPLGPGSLQLYIEHDPERHYFSFTDEERQLLHPVALFDLLANNGDRKGTHILVDPEQRLWLIDHGLCFHVDDKLRTVVWIFAGAPIPEELMANLAAFREKLRASPEEDGALASRLAGYLSQAEIKALGRRAGRLWRRGRFPNPPSNRRAYPWPPV